MGPSTNGWKAVVAAHAFDWNLHRAPRRDLDCRPRVTKQARMLAAPRCLTSVQNRSFTRPAQTYQQLSPEQKFRK
jgi:hypothetical protein